MTRNLSVEWGPYGIRVNGVAPGLIQETEGFEKLSGLQSIGSGRSESDFLIETSRKVPLRRLGHKSDVGMACLFLASSAASYITGVTLVVDGGQWLAHSWVSREDYHRIKISARPKANL
jgi:2,4-dienoyl-CoA reductase [(3E)-enoyl-CoA-producing], peroxisomal